MPKIDSIRLDGTNYDIERGMLPEVVSALPETGSEDTMYLVPSDTPGTITESATGENISITNELNIPASFQSFAIDGKAEQSGTPTPDAPVPISIVTGELVVKIDGSDDSQEFEVNLGKNLLYQTELPKTQVNVSMTYENGIFGLNGTASISSNAYIIPYNTGIVHLEAGESLTYYIERVSGTSRVRFLTYFVPDDGSSMDTTWGAELNDNESSKTVVKTATKAGSVKYVQFFLTNGVTYDSQVKVLVQKGNIANPTWAEYFTPIELAKIGTYQDRIYKDDDKWYIEKQVGKVVLDGTENWVDYITQVSGYYMAYETTKGKWGNAGAFADASTFMCDYFESKGNGFSTYDGSSIASTGFATYIKIADSVASDVATFKTWLGTHNTTVYYTLATPTTTEITNETLIGQLDAIESASLPVGAVNIYAEITAGSAMPTLEVGYEAIDQTKKYDELVWVEDDHAYELVGQAGAIQQLQRDVADHAYELAGHAGAIQQLQRDVAEIDDELLSRAVAFDTVADMKLATNLVDGSYACTLGYHSANDGGDATYRIRTKEAADIDDGGSIIELNGTLVAELILGNKVSVKQFGCYGDDIHDDTTALQNAINFVIANYKYELRVPGGIYVITSKVTINERCRISGEGSRLPTIKGSGENSYVEIKKGNDAFIYRLEIKNVGFSADTTAKYALYCDHINESTFENVEFGYGTICDFYAKNMEITSFYNCRFVNSNLGLHLDAGCVNNIFYTCNFWNNDTVIKITASVTEIVFNDIWFEKWGDHFINMDDATDITGLLFNSCYFLQSNNAKTSSNMFTENITNLNYRIQFDKCSFLFPFTTDSTVSLFHVSMNSYAKRKFIDIESCSFTQRGNIKSWIDDANITTSSTIQVAFTGTKWVGIPYLSDNKCKIHGLLNIGNSQQAFDQWVALPDQTGDVLHNWPSYKEGTIYYNSTNGLICYKSSIDSIATTTIPVVPASNVIPQSTATDITSLRADLNALISKLYDSKIIKSS